MGQLKLALNEAGPGAVQAPPHTHTHSVRPHVALSEPPLNILAVGSEGFCPLRRGRPLPPWAAEVRVPHGGRRLPSLTLLGPSGFIQFIILVAWTTRRAREGEETVRLLCCNLTSRMQLPGAPRPPQSTLHSPRPSPRSPFPIPEVGTPTQVLLTLPLKCPESARLSSSVRPPRPLLSPGPWWQPSATLSLAHIFHSLCEKTHSLKRKTKSCRPPA